MLSAVLIPTLSKSSAEKEKFCDPALTDFGIQYLKEGKDVF